MPSSTVHHRKRVTGAQVVKRLVLIDQEKCKPNSAAFAYLKRHAQSCGKDCISVVVGEDQKMIRVSEVACPVCINSCKQCPGDAVSVFKLPADLTTNTTHRYAPNSFKLHGLPLPRPGHVLGLLGTNGTGKSTALNILRGHIKPNLGKLEPPLPSWNDIATYYRGSDLQNYFTSLLQDKLRVAIYIGFIPGGDFLVVSIKGVDGSPGPGTISFYPLDGNGALGIPEVATTNGNTPFSFDFDSDGNLVVAEAFGIGIIGEENAGAVSLYAVEADGALTVSATSETVPTNQTITSWLRHFGGCVLTTNNGGNSISALSVEAGDLILLNGGSEPTLNAPIDASFSNDGVFFYILSTGHTLPPVDPGQGQPGIYVYSVTKCALTLIQTITDGIPTEFATIFGAVGLALF